MVDTALGLKYVKTSVVEKSCGGLKMAINYTPFYKEPIYKEPTCQSEKIFQLAKFLGFFPLVV